MALTEMEGPPGAPDPEEFEQVALRAFDALDAPEAQPGGAWRIDNAGSADWALRKLAVIRAKKAEADALARRQIDAVQALIEPYLAPITEWHEAVSNRLHAEAENFEALLMHYHSSVLAEDPNAKSISLPHGTLSSRKRPDGWDFDEEAFKAWAAQEAPQLLRAKVEIDKAETKKTLSVADDGMVVFGGEIVPGVTVTPGERNFTISTEEVAQ